MNETLAQADRALSQIGAFDLDVLLALAAVFLALSLAVEVIQELYKFVTTSKARAYRKALIDFVGEEIDDSRKDRSLGGMLLRGPFQWLGRQRPVHLLPADGGQLVRALERTVNPEVQAALQSVRDEASRQGGVPRNPSPSLSLWFEELRKAVDQSLCAQEIIAHLDELGVTVKPEARDPNRGGVRLAEKAFDAASVLDSLYKRFLPKAKSVEREFEQFAANFEYAYRRRNVRQTLVIGFLLAILLNLPLGALYRQARSLSPEQVAQVAESAVKLEESIRARERADETADAQERVEESNEKVGALLGDLDRAVRLTMSLGTEAHVFRPIWNLERKRGQAAADAVWERVRRVAALPNLLECLATAVLIVFGAPFWHRLSKALLAARRPVTAVAEGPARTGGGEP